MSACKVFISYSHADEWLKNELIAHFGALKRNGLVDVWHDRRIPAGGLIHDEIDANVQSSDLFLFLISTDFINSDYCFQNEYTAAVRRHQAGEAEIVPIIIRPCDWDVGNLRNLNALPKDGAPVTSGADAKKESQTRDQKWLEVIQGLKIVLELIKKKDDPPTVLKAYQDNLFIVDYIRHPSLAIFDERLILVDPDLYCETKKEQVSTFARLLEICASEKAALITGIDRSGKSVIAKQLHQLFSETDHPTILISGKDIKNKDVEKLIAVARNEQFAPGPFPIGRFRIIVDDFDECTLSDRVKESIVELLCSRFESCILVSFSNAPSVLFTSRNLPTPVVFQINPITDAKLFLLVQKWVSIGAPDVGDLPDGRVLPIFEKIQLVFEQTGLEKAPDTAATFLQFVDSVSGSDISFSSYAACYDMLIRTRLNKADINIQSHDEIQNFLSLVAYRAYVETGSACMGGATFDECLKSYEEQYLSSKKALRGASVGLFLKEEKDDTVRFLEEYLWFFLCARYVVKFLQVQNEIEYMEFVKLCTANIFQRKFANIVIYIAYFSTDKFVLQSLLETLDGLFSKASEWTISDDTRELMIGLMNKDQLQIESRSDVRQNRLQLLQEKIADIINEADRAVARYTLPFLHARIADSSNEDAVDVSIDQESYIKSVNALLRTHSVIGQILGARSGTFSAGVVLDCITRMVQASGRYVALNHAIAAVLIFDREGSVQEIGKAIRDDRLTAEEKYEKVTRIFAFWSVYLAHAGLARYLNQNHSIRALELLTEKYENDAMKTTEGNVPFNFTFVKAVARLYKSGRIDKREIEGILDRYGENSSIIALLRVVFHIYAYYMPFAIEDEQWLAQKLNMRIKKIEVQQMKAIAAGSRQREVPKQAN
jgi:TIR domain